MLNKQELLDELFDEAGAVGAIDIVGDLSPGNVPVCMATCLFECMHGIQVYVSVCASILYASYNIVCRGPF